MRSNRHEARREQCSGGCAAEVIQMLYVNRIDSIRRREKQVPANAVRRDLQKDMRM